MKTTQQAKITQIDSRKKMLETQEELSALSRKRRVSGYPGRISRYP